MKKVIALSVLLLFTACKGQEKEDLEPRKEENQEIAQEPKGSWQVQKEYDEQGNLIKYDSIYSYSYSNIKGDSIQINLDSIMDSFHGYFQDRAPFGWKDRFSFFPEHDSLFMKDFFTEDYFFKNWERHQTDVEGMIKKMDSLRNSFLQRYHPGLMDSNDSKEEEQF